MLRIMTVGIETQAAAERSLCLKLLLGNAFQKANKPTMNLIEFSSNICQRKVPLLFGYGPIEAIDSAVSRRVLWRLATFENSRQMLQRLLLPCRYMSKDVTDRPI